MSPKTNQNENIEQAKKEAVGKIESINKVEGFDPAPLALEIADMNDGGIRRRLPVMAQMAWFRLKYPEGKIASSVRMEKDYFVAEARIYVNYADSKDSYLAEGSASRKYIPDKPTVSPREWAQTAAIGIALRNAGFGLQFAVAGESYEDNIFDEFMETPFTNTSAVSINNTETSASSDTNINGAENQYTQSETVSAATAPEFTPLEKAMAAMCPIAKYKDKTLGDMIRIDSSALVYISKNGGKYGANIAEYAKLICENAAASASA